MDYPEHPSHPFRVEILSTPLLTVLVLAMAQPLMSLTVSAMPFDFGNPAWRVRALAGFLATAPQIAFCLALIAAVGIFSERYLPVRGVAVMAFALAVVLVPLLVLDWLDATQMRDLVPLDELHRYKLTTFQSQVMAALTVPAMLWLGWRSWMASRTAPPPEFGHGIVIDSTPSDDGRVDPRVHN